MWEGTVTNTTRQIGGDLPPQTRALLVLLDGMVKVRCEMDDINRSEFWFSRLMSACPTRKGEDIWIITEADRSSPCLLPCDS